MKGFFNLRPSSSGHKQSKGKPHNCLSCGLYKDAHTPKFEPYGEGKKGIMIVVDSVGVEDDKRGKPLQGADGRLLRSLYARLGIDLYEDAVIVHSVNCAPPRGRDPSSHEIDCCRAVRVLPAIEEHKPKVIILHGASAVTSVIGPRWGTISSISRWVGWTIPDRHYNAWLCPTYSASYILRQEEMDGVTELRRIWKNHVKSAISLVDTPFPDVPKEEDVHITDDVQGVLENILDEKPRYLAFDTETSGIKPYDHERHKIFCIAFSWDGESAVTIPAPTEKKGIHLLKQVMQHKGIRKIAANMKFEYIWMAEMYGIEVRPWDFDTMLAAHVLDNRTEISGLKFQSYVRFGVVGYDSDVNSFLKSASVYEPNNVEDYIAQGGYESLARYCGMDAMLTYRLAMLQKQELGIDG